MRIFLDANILFSGSKSDGAVRKLLERLQSGMQRTGAIRIDRELESRLPLPERDRPILAAAIHARCDALVTGDLTHFGTLFGKRIEGVVVHSPRSIALALKIGQAE